MVSITVKPETRDSLKAIGNKGDTYNDIVDMLLRYYCIQKLNKKVEDILENEEFVPLDWEKV
ncbi:hypothetical protein L0665_01620 [Methanogenium marinum]|uniref:Uncharacterized protein n=1 Tax=Methanogenium marinum TaxID=348610 RepID=A0A9Q4KRP0_9EURY|nr:hypothetical protein [Methanogenium marinum]MDE4907319.1 hypothetical protein [Methanogenium marinum]